MASGGVGGSEGAVVLLIEGYEDGPEQGRRVGQGPQRRAPGGGSSPPSELTKAAALLIEQFKDQAFLSD